MSAALAPSPCWPMETIRLAVSCSVTLAGVAVSPGVESTDGVVAQADKTSALTARTSEASFIGDSRGSE